MNRFNLKSPSFKAAGATLFIVALCALIVSFIVFFIRDDLINGVSRRDLEDLTKKAVSNVRVRSTGIRYGADFSFVENNAYFLILAEDGMVLAGKYPVSSGVEAGPPTEGFRALLLPVGEYYVYDIPIPGARGDSSLWIRGIAPSVNAGMMNRVFLVLLMVIMPLFACLAGIASYLVSKKSFMALVERERRFTSDISHELRTPISVALAQSDYLINYSDDRAEWDEGVGIIRDEALKMKDMTESLLSLSRMEQGRDRVTMESLDLKEVIEEAAREATGEASEGAGDLKINTDLVSAKIYGNAPLLKRVFANLLGNTIKYGNNLANISLKIKGKRAAVTYSDAGTFSDKKALDHLFDPFFRGDSARTSGNGFGLGLALTERIIRIHKGKITAGLKPGGGIIFTVSFPITSL